MWLTFLTILLNIIDLFLPFLVAFCYFTLVERKMAGVQRRRGLNLIGYSNDYKGLRQLLADCFIFLVKEIIYFLFYMSFFCMIFYALYYYFEPK
jgi:NADH:ubiquinone oxidoreductase subunit H